MSLDISEDTDQQAHAAAETLRAELLPRLLGQPVAGWRCCCGGLSAAPSKVVDIAIPSSYRGQVGLSSLWRCILEDHEGKRSSCGLETFLTHEEIVPMFLNAFRGIEIQLDRTGAMLYDESGWSNRRRRFNPSGRTVSLEEGKAVFVRPVGEPADSVWLHCELRVDRNLPGHQPEKLLFACNIDALEYGARRGAGNGMEFRLPDGSDSAIVRTMRGCDADLPIARLESVDRLAGVAVFELDESVEEFSIAE